MSQVLVLLQAAAHPGGPVAAAAAPAAATAAGAMLALLKYQFYPLFILDNGMNLISNSLTVLTPA